MCFIIYLKLGLDRVKEMTRKEFADLFLFYFAKDLSLKELRKAHVGIKDNQCLWNLFGYHLVPCMEGETARSEYDKANKEDAFEIQYENSFFMSDKETKKLQNNHQTAEGIDRSGVVEFYVIGKNFSWCYVITHAGDSAGPYFYLRKTQV